ncbi:hypothetical protein [Noviherbaspirillum sp. Root189]|nr:hypothetical protein [Noviherbaspirillum sp. Root189]
MSIAETLQLLNGAGVLSLAAAIFKWGVAMEKRVTVLETINDVKGKK